jgi:hypothetical protein
MGHRPEAHPVKYLGATADPAQSALASAGFPAPRPLVAATSPVRSLVEDRVTLVPGDADADGRPTL